MDLKTELKKYGPEGTTMVLFETYMHRKDPIKLTDIQLETELDETELVKFALRMHESELAMVSFENGEYSLDFSHLPPASLEITKENAVKVLKEVIAPKEAFIDMQKVALSLQMKLFETQLEHIPKSNAIAEKALEKSNTANLIAWISIIVSIILAAYSLLSKS